LTAVLGPKVMAAGATHDDHGGRFLLRRYAIVAFVPAMAYLGIAGFDVPWNPMTYIVPAAYAVAGLVAVMVVANLSQVLVLLRVEELMGARREVDLVKVSTFASVCTIVVAATAAVTRAFAYPLSTLAMGSTRYVGYRFYRHSVYGLSNDD
ncbi:MAG: hypothetical protein KDB69_02335, partial [Acidimicrobiia bacterium]|nr:hypothetical protein [Acidimicrobiia bacterium]